MKILPGLSGLAGQSLLKLEDLSADQLLYLVDQAILLKQKKQAGCKDNLLKGKNILLIFDKPSTRTRCAFEVAAYDEGACTTYFSNSHMGHKESIEDTAKVLGRFYHGIAYRGYQDSLVEQLAQYSGIPVWNALTDGHHPTQALADLMTVKEKIAKPLDQLKFIYTGDAGNNVCHSLMVVASKIGFHFTAFSPPALWLSRPQLKTLGLNTDYVQFSNDPAVLDQADVIYTDVWVSMGDDNMITDKISAKIKLLSPYQVNQAMLDKTHNPNVIFMHCLPAFHDSQTAMGREMEVTDDIFRSRHSVVFDQAENCLHTIKALMIETLCG